MIKKSISLSGHATSLALEEDFWDVLEEISKGRNQTLKDFIAYEDCHRKRVNLASHLRVLCLKYYQAKVNKKDVNEK